MFKKVLLVFLSLNILFLSVFTPVARAQEWYVQSFFDWYKRVYDTENPDEIFGERYTAAQVEWVVFSLLAFLINHVGIKDLNWCIISTLQAGLEGGLFEFFRNIITHCPAAADELCDIATWSFFTGFDSFGICNVSERLGLMGFQNNSFSTNSTVASASNNSRLSSFLSYNIFPNRGISFVGYIKNAAYKFKVIPEAQAQGFGFTTAAHSVVNIWRAIRDLTYFLLVIGILIISFMIMLRVKLSPQTTITIQSALPKIIITLILITFSYAIAGLLIDLMYVVLGLLTALFTSTISMDSFEEMFASFTYGRTIGTIFMYWILWGIAAQVTVYQFFKGIFLGVPALLIVGIFWIFLLLLLVVISIKLLWMLVKTFVSILLLIIASPLYILIGLFGFGGFGAWFKAMISNLAVYPVVAVLLVFSFLFLATPFHGRVGELIGETLIPFKPNPEFVIMGENAWIPPLTFGSDAIGLMMVFVSLATFSLIPKAAEIIKSLISGRPFGYGAAIGEALAIPMAIPMAAYKAGYEVGKKGYGAVRAAGLESIYQQLISGGGTGVTPSFWNRIGRDLGLQSGQSNARQKAVEAFFQYLKSK